MFKRITLNRALFTGLAMATVAVGCDKGSTTPTEKTGVAQDEIVEVPHTTVERQSIGNCWLYAQATWVESMHLAYQQANAGNTGPAEDTCAHSVTEEGVNLDASCNTCATSICDADAYCCNTAWDNLCTGAVEELCGADAGQGNDGGEPVEVVELDISQSYWTYWHWFDQVTGNMWDDEIQTGGNQWKSHGIVRDRGYMLEGDFVPEDVSSEMSDRQSSAKTKINNALKDGALSTREARRDGNLVRQVFDDAWGLSPEVRDQLNKVFGEDGEGTLRDGGQTEGTNIVHASKLKVRYSRMRNGVAEEVDSTLLSAVKEWQTVSYPRTSNQRKTFLKRVMRALFDRQPVVITWDVDFNAMENGQNERRGSFNKTTLDLAGSPGRQGGHMTVLADLAVMTQEFGLLEAGVTLDPVADAAKFEAALADSSEVTLLRTKNSWGALRPDRAFAPGFPGYHDLAMDYMNGPIKFCPSVDNPTNDNCTGETTPFRSVMLPPGY